MHSKLVELNVNQIKQKIDPKKKALSKLVFGKGLEEISIDGVLKFKTNSVTTMPDTGFWHQWIVLVDWFDAIAMTDLSYTERANLAIFGDLLVRCDDPSFLYHGFSYILTTQDANADTYPDWDTNTGPERRPPDIRNPERKGIVCKHLVRILEILPFKVSSVARAMKEFVESNKITLAETEKGTIAYVTADGPPPGIKLKKAKPAEKPSDVSKDEEEEKGTETPEEEPESQEEAPTASEEEEFNEEKKESLIRESFNKDFQRRRLQQVENLLDMYRIKYTVSRARTGTYYVKALSSNGQEVKIRIADHSDAYATADFEIGPDFDDYSKVKTWVYQNGERKPQSKNKWYTWIRDGVVVAPTYTQKAQAVKNNPGSGAVLHVRKKWGDWQPYQEISESLNTQANLFEALDTQEDVEDYIYRLKRGLRVRYTEFPLSVLYQQAKHFKKFVDFIEFYAQPSVGYYWYLTDDPEFDVSKSVGKDSVFIISHSVDKLEAALGKGYAVLLDVSKISPNDLWPDKGAFIQLSPENQAKLKQLAVYDTDRAGRESYRFQSELLNTRKELKDLWISAQYDLYEHRLIEQEMNPLDAEYMEAADAEDWDKCEMMVSQAAHKAGYTFGPVYRGDKKGISTFKVGAETEFVGGYWTTDEKIAEAYADSCAWDARNSGCVYTANLRFKKLANLEEEGEAWDIAIRAYLENIPAIKKEWVSQDTFRRWHGGEMWQILEGFFGQDVAKELQRAGYDCVYFTEEGFETYVIFNPTQVKNVAPVIYDEQGNIIPLSRRFNSASLDFNESLDYKLPLNFKVQKYGSCMLAAEILTKKILKDRKDFKVVEGYITFPTVDWEEEHTWIEFDSGEILDPTKAQWGISNIEYLQRNRKEFTPDEYLSLCSKHPIENPQSFYEEIQISQKQVDDFDTLAQAQRGEPEEAMLAVQRITRGGLLSWVCEHVGDLTNRMAQRIDWFKGNYSLVDDKVHKTLRSLKHPYGFEKESWEQIEKTYKFLRDGGELQEFPTYSDYQKAVVDKLEAYAQAHSKLKVYNSAQMYARNAAVNLGRLQYDMVIWNLEKLMEVLDRGEEAWEEFALRYFGRAVESRISEMAKPTESMRNKTYFHGTSCKACAESIWEDGILPSSIVGTSYSGVTTPIKDQVYITSRLYRAIGYVSGIEDYGYIFEIPGSELVDVFPDEDQLADALGLHFTATKIVNHPWLDKYRPMLEVPYSECRGILSSEEVERFSSKYNTVLEGVIKGDFECRLIGAKLIYPRLSEEEILDLMSSSDNIAHRGSLKPSKMWRFNVNDMNRKLDEVDMTYEVFSNYAELIASRNAVNESQLAEMAKPTEDILNKTFYHGTPKKEYAEDIWKNGIQPNKDSRYAGSLQEPLPGMVYLTQDLNIALQHAIGSEDYFYLLEVPGSQFVEVYPDEDNVADAIRWWFLKGQEEDSWVTNYYDIFDSLTLKDVRKFVGFKIYPELKDENITLLALLEEGIDSISIYHIASKMIFPQLTEVDIFRVIQGNWNLAHRGPLMPAKLWRILRDDCPINGMTWEEFVEYAELIAEREVVTESLQEAKGTDFYKQYEDIPRKTFDEIVNADPLTIVDDETGEQKRVGSYSKWLLKLYKNEDLKLEDLYKATEYLDIFERHKKRLEIDQRDINRYKSLQDLFRVLEDSGVYELKTKGEKRQEIQQAGRDDVTEVYEDNKWLVLIPESEEAAIYWGEGTQWCTASRGERNYFNYYNDQGPLYIIIEKEDGVLPEESSNKYQFHVSSDEVVINDKADESILRDWKDFINSPEIFSAIVYDILNSEFRYINANDVVLRVLLILYSLSGINKGKTVSDIWDMLGEDVQADFWARANELDFTDDITSIQDLIRYHVKTNLSAETLIEWWENGSVGDMGWWRTTLSLSDVEDPEIWELIKQILEKLKQANVINEIPEDVDEIQDILEDEIDLITLMSVAEVRATEVGSYDDFITKLRKAIDDSAYWSWDFENGDTVAAPVSFNRELYGSDLAAIEALDTLLDGSGYAQDAREVNLIVPRGFEGFDMETFNEHLQESLQDALNDIENKETENA